MNSLGIFGTSGFAREVADIAYELGYTPFYVARTKEEAALVPKGDSVLMESELNHRTDAAYALGIGDNAVRERLALKYAGTLRFPSLVHPSATFGRGQREFIIGRTGVVVCAGARFTNNIEVGAFCIFNLNATIGHDAVFEDFVNVAPGVSISGNVHVGKRCWLGTGAVINQGTTEAKLKIGPDTVIGSGAAVIKDCESNSTYAGVPAKKIK